MIKEKLKSLRFRMLLPVIAMTLFIVVLLTVIFTNAYKASILQQEQEVNTVGFETISKSVTPLIESSINEVRNMMADDRIASYAGMEYESEAERIHARIKCRDYLRRQISGHEGIFGLLFMRQDGSIFGTLPEGNFFLDNPAENPLPEEIRNRILNIPLGEIAWNGPVSGSQIYGFRTSKTPETIMMAAWKTVDVRYNECYAILLMDNSIFDRQFEVLQDGKSIWHLYTENRVDFYHTGEHDCLGADLLIDRSNSGDIFLDENNRPVCAFSMTMTTPPWTLVREVSMENYEQVIRRVRSTLAVLAAVIFLIALTFYELWLKKYMRQFRSLLRGITRMGQEEEEPVQSAAFSITEFETMRQEINRTSRELTEQMDTIRRMEREQAEQERVAEELRTARELQRSALPMNFPPFPGRKEFSLYASMTPAREVGGDFYDFFMVDADHLALVIADVSGKGIPAALFMMMCKTMLMNQLMAGCDPASGMERVNRQLCERNESAMFVTAWVAVVEISTGRGLACNAGHENPMIRKDGEPFEMETCKHGIFAGISKKAKYENRAFELHPGDCLFVYTDGVPESINTAEEMFGEDRLLETLNRDAEAEPEELIHRIRQEVDRFAEGVPQFDDITMLSFKYYGNPV